jgi:anti-anti-sigma regulatory factor
LTRAPAGAVGVLGFDPEAVLLKEPGILIDPHFLGALHSELRGELAPAEADVTLLQMGFLHGLQDAMRAVSTSLGAALPEPQQVVGPSLAFRFRSLVDSEEPGAIALAGFWPEPIEASAYTASLGRSDEHVCYLSAGYASGWLSGALDVDILALESSCCACGDDRCRFDAREASAWRESGDRLALAVLESLPFGAFRAFVRSNLDALGAGARAHEPIEPGSSVIHIWGPVMVVPFHGRDSALNAVELIGRDPAARDVSVVVVDLSGASIDEAFGAAALEQLVDRIESWGAEAIFAAVSPLSEAAVASLERAPLLVHKDLAEAITAAFQLASAQQNPA